MFLPENFYMPIDVIKTGEYGDVKLVYDKIGKQICVIKQRSMNTVEIYQKLKNLDCRYVPQIFRLMVDGDKLFVVEEYVSGMTLAEILKYENTFDEDAAAQILRQLCECLVALHAQNIIHRDIKPSNIMLTRDHVIRLIDFSISRIEKEGSPTDTEFLGTRGYAPPEQYGFGQTDARSDIFSLGVTIKRLLGNDYDGWLDPIINRCTVFDPGNRYQSAEDLLDDFDRRRWQDKFTQMKFFATEGIPATDEVAEPAEGDDAEEELDIYQKFERLQKQLEDLDAVMDSYSKTDENSMQEYLLEKGIDRIMKDFEDTADSVTPEDFDKLTPEEFAEVEAEFKKFHDAHDDYERN